MKIATAQEMKALDERTIAQCGVPSILLMENAAFGILDRLTGLYPALSSYRVAVLCGGGNNGGDGLALARHLHRRGVGVEVVLLAEASKLTADAKTNWEILSKLGPRAHLIPSSAAVSGLAAVLEGSDLLIDAIFGTGLSKPLSGHWAEAVDCINRSGKPVVSIDIPSGISSDSGKVLGAAVRAAHTLTLGLPKRGHFLSPGLEHRGELGVVDIGIPQFLVEQSGIRVELITAESMAAFLPPRPRSAHKGTYGHLLILAGSRGKAGASVLASQGALRSGVGLVTLAHPQGISPPQLPMEAMTLPLPETSDGAVAESGQKLLWDALPGKDALVLGPGLSQNPETQELARHLIFESPLPIVVDADGINALSGNTSGLRSSPGPRLLTPHPGEMARVMGISPAAVLEDRMGIALGFAAEHRAVLVLKGACTLVASPDGRLLVNPTGNPGMAKGGSGDVLSGMIGALLAQGVPPLEAAALGVYVHGLAGDLASHELGEIGMLPSQLIDRLPSAFERVRRLEAPS